MPRPAAVPASQWKRGLQASKRLGRWLHTWEECARRMREGEEPELRPAPRRRKRPA